MSEAYPKIYSPNLFHAFSELRAGFTTRHMGDGIEPLRHFLNARPEALLSLKQIHSNRIIEINSNPPAPLLEGDGLITHIPNIILTIRTADCVPILLYDPHHHAISALHAGWRGIESSIIESALARMQSAYDTMPQDLRVAIGPAICARCFEIGPEVAKKFTARFGARAPLSLGKTDRAHLDLVACCKLIFADAGVPNTQLESMDLCTSCRSDLFYSYRRDGGSTGRLVGFIGISPMSRPQTTPLPKISTRCHVLILQHPQEPDKELGTARLAHAVLPESTLKIGLSWPNLSKALGRKAEPGRWAALYLGSGIKEMSGANANKNPEKTQTMRAPALIQPKNPEILLVDKRGIPLPHAISLLADLDGIVVLDGTWSQAKSLWWRNAWLTKLRRAVLVPKQTSLYGPLRKEPRRECLSTIESIALALLALGEPAAVGEELQKLFADFLHTYRLGLIK